MQQQKKSLQLYLEIQHVKGRHDFKPIVLGIPSNSKLNQYLYLNAIKQNISSAAQNLKFEMNRDYLTHPCHTF